MTSHWGILVSDPCLQNQFTQVELRSLKSQVSSSCYCCWEWFMFFLLFVLIHQKDWIFILFITIKLLGHDPFLRYCRSSYCLVCKILLLIMNHVLYLWWFSIKIGFLFLSFAFELLGHDHFFKICKIFFLRMNHVSFLLFVLILPKWSDFDSFLSFSLQLILLVAVYEHEEREWEA
jgi:hypothetical protein